MNQQTQDLLGYQNLIDCIRSYAQTEVGHQFLSDLRPTNDSQHIASRFGEVEEMLRYRAEKGAFSLGGVENPEADLADIDQDGAALLPEQFCRLRTLLRVASDLDHDTSDGDWPTIRAVLSPPDQINDLISKIDRVFDDDGELKETADPELGRIRKQLQTARQKVQTALKAYFKGNKARFLIEEPFVTQRNLRFVIPVRVEHQGAVPGIAHGLSSSGATVFLEPLKVIPLNNEVLYCGDREREIIRRILLKLTNAFRPHRGALIKLARQIGALDSLQAKAAFAETNKCIVPTIEHGLRLELEEARHPLLIQQLGYSETKPISLSLNAQTRGMVISGPNTGGKTVTLKTLGIFSLMAQSGLPVPAKEARIPLFRQIVADIGDHQSLSESLSTFSAHILRIQQIFEQLETPSLILLDELGTGTDPEHGANLAVAILEELLEWPVLIVATTHHQALKQFASSSDSLTNASVGIDPETFEPSYQLKMGLAGNSNPLEIAQRLGLNSSIIERARSRVDTRQAEMDALLEELRIETQATRENRKNLATREREIEEENRRREREYERLVEAQEKKHEKQIELGAKRFQKETERFIQDVEKRVEARQLRADANRRREALKAAFRAEHRSKQSQPDKEASAEQSELVPGDLVKHTLFGGWGRVLEVKSGKVTMDLDGKRMTCEDRHLQKISEQAVIRQPRKHLKIHVVESNDPEINLVGLRADDASERVDKFLDRAVVSQLHEVRVIHGFGKGKLRKMLDGLLRDHPQVEHWKTEGGVTFIKLES